MKWLKRVGIALVLLVLVVKFVLLTARPLPDKARFALDLNALREAAGPTEALPESLHALQVASFEVPELGPVAGGGFSTVRFGFYGWQLRYADGTSAMLDPVHSHATNDLQAKGAPYDDAAWAEQEKAIAQASVIAVTHEHYDHLGGVADSAHFDTFGNKLKLTARQRQKAPFSGVARDLSGEPTLESGPEGSIHKVAPGIVAITAAGHTPGSQMLYLRLKSGPELLLLGDVAWQSGNLERGVTRARVVSWIMREDDEAVVHQLRAAIDFKKANPQIDLVVAHDVVAMDKRFASGAVVKGYAP
jgi:glyoxylase-like metal-dependent hydrolase (beta-lactamase superfamily II)